MYFVSLVPVLSLGAPDKLFSSKRIAYAVCGINPFGVCRALPPIFGEADWSHCMRCVRCMRCLRCSGACVAGLACLACLACVVHVACVACVACRNLRPVLPQARGDTKRRRDSEWVAEWPWGFFWSKNVPGMETRGVADFWKTRTCEKTTFFGRPTILLPHIFDGW